MRLAGLLFMFLAAQSAFGLDCDLKLGIYVPEEVNDVKCAVLVSQTDVDKHGEEPMCGAWISFVHDPRYMPNFDCPSVGVTLYPIGVTVENDSSFVDLRGCGCARYKYYGPTHLKHGDLD